MVDKEVTEHKQMLKDSVRLARELQENLMELYAQVEGCDDVISENPLAMRLRTTISDLGELQTMLETAADV